MSTDIGELIKKRFKNLSEFSRLSDVPYGTLYDIASGKTKFEKIGIGVFMKIAHGLGMTAEELYYGEAVRMEFADPSQEALNVFWESMNTRGREALLASAELMSGSPDTRIEKDGSEAAAVQAQERSA